MDVRRLRILRELADRGSVTAVAAALNYTPSAVSQQLKVLSREAGIALTVPDGRGLRLTEAGAAVVAGSEDVLTALGRLDETLAGLRERPLGTVRVALFPSAARLLLPGLLRRAAVHDGLTLSCRDRDLRPEEVPASAAEVDVVVTHHDERLDPFTGGRLRVRPLLREPLDVALPIRHPLAARAEVGLDDLVDEGWIGVGVGWPVDDVLRSLALVTGTAPRVVQRINDFSVTEELVADGHGVALLPRYSTDHRDGSRLALRPLAGVRAARLVHAVSRAEAVERPAVRLVLDELAAEADAVRARAG
ncbi:MULTISPECIES: LysR family transcriptional regulator [Pseudonocardia]|uniref:HTH-type transcriptional regulator GltC n=2 Tax=Pseudonocardia TaxID=1847 RepID=A0A1Y2MWM5_PSEAH|nr:MULTISPECIES: LysR family transcriptional regulator [Pseudonocardia]OSY39038.1 HTH-type transcriptional regulator GltC [Pseudonocardia autotrophica]TDN71365.1 DNA-binding transcriptional LysR family regulator [Pseudonocardia autotrophica]BBG02041.1 LysR family transcriptional regulator [Pseudonocardia autotrophica]GEC23204.1 LysR family transcriptional regulator [Pseudonocardia saturnea]